MPLAAAYEAPQVIVAVVQSAGVHDCLKGSRLRTRKHLPVVAARRTGLVFDPDNRLLLTELGREDNKPPQHGAWIRERHRFRLRRVFLKRRLLGRFDEKEEGRLRRLGSGTVQRQRRELMLAAPDRRWRGS